MKFGKRIRKELSPSLLWGSVDYKALKKIAKTIRLIPRQPAAAPNHNGLGGEISDINDKVDKFFARVEVEKEKVAKFYHTREAWCFLMLERSRGALFALTRRASQEKLSPSSRSPGLLSPHEVCGDDAVPQAGPRGAGGARKTAGELEGKFLEAKAGLSVLLAECGGLLKFVEMNMHAFRKLLKKLDKWTGGDRGRVYFTDMMQNQPWITGRRAQGVLRMASAMTEHLRSLHPALAPGRAAAGGQPSCWAHRIVYSVGSFDRPKLYPGGVEPAAATAAIPPLPVTLGNDGNGKKGHSCSSSLAYANSIATPVDGRLPSSPHPAAASGGGGSGGGASTAPSPFSPPHGGHAVAMAEAAVAEATVEGSRLRFLREFGAIVIVGVYSDAAHAACHGGVAPVETFRDRVARVSPHADSVVAIDSPNSACVLDTLLRASANIAASVAAITTAGAGGSLGARGVISGDPGCRNGLISVAGRGSFFSGSTVDGACRGAAAAGLARDMNGEGAAAEVGPQGVGMGMGYYCPPQGIDVGVPPPPPAPKSFFESVNCCFVTCDWEGMGAGWTEEGRRVRRATVAIMRQSMPVFPLPSPTWGRGFDEQGDAEEEADGPARRYW